MDIGNLAHAVSGAAGFSPNNLIGLISVGTMVLNRIPGLDTIFDYFHTLNIDLSTLTTWFMLATALWTGSVFLWGKFWSLVEEHYSCSIRLIEGCGPIYDDFHTWLCDVKADDLRGSRKYDITMLFQQEMRPSSLPRVNYEITPDAEYWIRHGGQLIKITKVTVESKYHQDEDNIVTLMTYGRSHAVLKGLLQEVLEHSQQARKGMTTVYKPMRVTDHSNNVSWQRTIFRPKRPISSVVLEDDQKDKIVSDIKEYLLPPTNKWYANRGLPYRRGYLLYGPPGTGKTSLSMALAAHFSLNVFALSLTHRGLDDENLSAYFALLPTYCIVLLEDIDASGVRRANDSIAPAPVPISIPPPTGDKETTTAAVMVPPPPSFNQKTKVTFSGLINAIDGATAGEGRILIMTTNHREHLDEALIRPGRVDLQIAFSYASRPVIIDLFENLYDVSGDDLVADYIPADFPERKEVVELAAQFADVVPEGRFTPAEIQGLLLVHKKDPRKAVAVAPAWVEKRLALKEENESRGKVAKASVDSS